MRKNIQFHEVQYFRQGWLWYLLVSSSLISILPLVVFVAAGELRLSEGLAAIGLVLLITLINLAAFYYAHLEVKISEEGIAYRWRPFFRKYSLLKWSDVEYVAMRKYSAFRFGYHKHKEFGKVHNVDGSHGYQVVLQNGRKYYFGTQKKLSVESVLQATGKMKL